MTGQSTPTGACRDPAFCANPNRSLHSITSPAPPSGLARRFHQSLPGSSPTPLTSLPRLADDLGLGAVLVKDESSRLGLPAFKMLGASWAVYRALADRCDSPPDPDLTSLRAALTDIDPVRLLTATDGNHGRAVARMARLLGLAATIVVPRAVPEAAVAHIRDEGADVQVLDVPYDEAVRRAAVMPTADPSLILVQDTSWPGYEQVPRWIVDGYATLFEEIEEQISTSGFASGLMVVPAGVGSLAEAAAQFARTPPYWDVVVVEPDTADCLWQSVAAGELISVPTKETIMAGLNCGTPSALAWPLLRDVLSGAVRVSDEEAAAAMRQLARESVDSGACGAATLAGLRALVRDDQARHALGLAAESTVLLLNTEGAASAV